jgi:NarL family two-component system response regulator LiaR
MMISQKTIRVLIVDDHQMLRKGLTVVLKNSTDIEVVGEAASGTEALDLCDRLNPDVILMDLVMPGMDGVTTIQHIRERAPYTQIIALTSFDNEELVHAAAAIEAGALSYLLKNVSSSQLIDAIHSAYRGRPMLGPEATQALIQAVHRPKAPNFHLTSREIEVLSLMVKGYTNSDIAQQLVISPSTAKKHVANVLSKLGATTRTQAVALALQHRLVSSHGK